MFKKHQLTKLLLRKRELAYKFHYCLISTDMYSPCGTPRSTSGGKTIENMTYTNVPL